MVKLIIFILCIINVILLEQVKKYRTSRMGQKEKGVYPDDKCFKYSIECGYCNIYDKAHPEKMFHYKKVESGLTFEHINFPANKNDIDKFEENNTTVSINVYEVGYNEQIVSSRKFFQKQDDLCHVDLLRVGGGDYSHYLYI